jgi:Flp pilus assembly CpaF family ATPase
MADQDQLLSSQIRFMQMVNTLTETLQERIELLSRPPGPPWRGKEALEMIQAEKPARELGNMGAIQALLDDDTINDILINSSHSIYVERNGRLEKSPIRLNSEEEVLNIAEKIVRAVDRTFDRNRPLVDARLLDGSRVNIVGWPLSVDGTTISIRKFSK